MKIFEGGGKAKQVDGGQSLGFVLAAAALGLLAAFVATAVATTSLRLASRTSSAQVAENLAESVIQEAIAHLQDDLGYSQAVRIEGFQGLPLGSWGALAFDSDSGLPFSTNNFLGDSPEGWNRVLPERTVHLVGVGESGGVRRVVEAVLHLPSFPVAMACDGPVRVRNSLIGASNGVDEGGAPRAWTADRGFDLDEDELEPGHLISNSPLPEAAVLDRETRITGDLQAFGGVQTNGARIEGEVRSPWSERAPLPNFDLDSFDPRRNVNTHYEALESSGEELHLVGNVRQDGPLTVARALNLDNAFLYVDGDLTVNGPLRGTGAVVVRGEVRLEGAVHLASNEQVALLAEGGVTLTGESRDRSLFQGLLYCRGPFRAQSVTILGGFMVDNGAEARIVDCTVLYSELNIAPKYRRTSYASVPRFRVPTDFASTVRRDPEGFPTGSFPTAAGRDRHVSSVLGGPDPSPEDRHPDWDSSRWTMDDPATLTVTWVGDQALYRYSWWGRDGGTHLPSASHIPEGSPGLPFDHMLDLVMDLHYRHTGFAEQLVHHGITVPPEAQYRAYLTQVATHLEQPPEPDMTENFQFLPNEFLNLTDRPRLLFRRVVPTDG